MDFCDKIRNKFKTDFADLPTLNDNQKDNIDKSDLWCRLTVLSGDNNQITNGGEKNQARLTGVVIAQLFSPLGTGDGVSKSKAKQIIDKFSAYRDSKLSFKVGTMKRIGKREGWYQINVNIPYTFDNVIGEF